MEVIKENKNILGESFDSSTVDAVWEKALIHEGYNPSIYRKDKCGYLIKFEDYGSRESINGWEIDHINPISNGGGDEIENLQPLHYMNNIHKADSIDWNC